jgi:hypothetical protein
MGIRKALAPSKQSRPPEDERYVEVTHALKMSLRQGSFRSGELLTQVAQEKLYGHWKTFKNYVVGELRITEVQAYRLMFAFDVLQLVASRRLPLPVNERQVRPLRALRKEKSKMLQAWSRACKQKQYGQPTYLDVQREVNLLRSNERSAEEEQAYRAYRQHIQSIRIELSRASDIMATGDLESYLELGVEGALGEVNRPKRFLLELLLKIGVELGDHFRKLTGEEISFESRE